MYTTLGVGIAILIMACIVLFACCHLYRKEKRNASIPLIRDTKLQALMIDDMDWDQHHLNKFSTRNTSKNHEYASIGALSRKNTGQEPSRPKSITSPLPMIDIYNIHGSESGQTEYKERIYDMAGSNTVDTVEQIYVGVAPSIQQHLQRVSATLKPAAKSPATQGPSTISSSFASEKASNGDLYSAWGMRFADKKGKKIVGFVDPAPYDPDASLRSIDDLNRLE